MSAAKRLAAAVTVALLMIVAAVSFASSASAYPTDTSPTLALDHNSGPVGDAVTVTGAKYTPNADVTLEFHSTSVTLGTAHTDGTGAFSKSITVPSVALGAHSIVGVDTVNPESASAAFTVTGAGTGSGGGIANTGVAVIGLGAIGGVLFTGGGLMLLAGRRRKVVA
jgi:hypothetical protein